MTKFVPRQQVSALVSHSFAAKVPSFGSGWLAVVVAILRSVVTAETAIASQPPGDDWRSLLFLFCSLLPPIIELLLVTWLIVLLLLPSGTALVICERNSSS